MLFSSPLAQTCVHTHAHGTHACMHTRPACAFLQMCRPQAECLNQQGVLGGSNLVYCAPTSGGKSLVAEVLMLRRIVTTGKAALLVSQREHL